MRKLCCFYFKAADCEFACNHPALSDPKGSVPMLIHGDEAEGWAFAVLCFVAVRDVAVSCNFPASCFAVSSLRSKLTVNRP
jgi:hypothetical protein